MTGSKISTKRAATGRSTVRLRRTGRPFLHDFRIICMAGQAAALWLKALWPVINLKRLMQAVNNCSYVPGILYPSGQQHKPPEYVDGTNNNEGHSWHFGGCGPTV